jgi:FK506-binding protein 1
MGVTKEIIREGDGTNFPKKGEQLSMHYKGSLASDGTQVQYDGIGKTERKPERLFRSQAAHIHCNFQFDSSYDRGKPFSFTIGKREVIRGWDEGGKEILTI